MLQGVWGERLLPAFKALSSLFSGGLGCQTLPGLLVATVLGVAAFTRFLACFGRFFFFFFVFLLFQRLVFVAMIAFVLAVCEGCATTISVFPKASGMYARSAWLKMFILKTVFWLFGCTRASVSDVGVSGCPFWRLSFFFCPFFCFFLFLFLGLPFFCFVLIAFFLPFLCTFFFFLFFFDS